MDSGDQIIYSVIAGIKRFISPRYEKKERREGRKKRLSQRVSGQWGRSVRRARESRGEPRERDKERWKGIEN